MPASSKVSQSVQDDPIVSTSPSKCEWTNEQESKMIEHLITTQRNNKSNKGFSKATWSLIATQLEGTEGASKTKTGETVHAHYNVLSKRYKDAKDLLKKSGAGWNYETNMVDLKPEIWNEMAQKPTGANKRLGWFRRNPFPLFDSVGELVDPGMAKGTGKIDSFAPENNAVGDGVNDAKNDKEGDSSSGKSMSGSQDGSLDEARIQRAIEINEETPAPTSSTQAEVRPGNKFMRGRRLKHDRSPEADDAPSKGKSRKPFERRQRKTAAQAGDDFLNGIGSISDKFITHMANDTNAVASGSSIQPYDFLTTATRGLHQLGLSEDELFKSMELLKKDVDYAKMFVGLEENKKLQLGWIRGKLAGN